MIRCLGSSLCSFATVGSLKRAPLLAAAALLQFDTYLRPGEMLALKKGQVLSPVRNAGVAHRRWELAICPATELSTTKSGSQDDTLFVSVASRFRAVGALRTLHSRCAAPEDSLFGDMNKGSTMPALLWVFCGFMQCLTRFATPDLLRMLFTNEQTWPPSRNAVADDRPSPWYGMRKVTNRFVNNF